MKYLKTAAGEELTPEYLEELVAEAEAGYEGFQVKVVRTGRPPISETGPSKRLQVRVDEQLQLDLQLIANERGTTLSAVAREALAQYVKKAA
ncbi:MAG: ribbon-helix-helix protein, CopG family [Solirubrobacterales bacterium]|nr:ribbon-helix-helix protein, CopG family [Solirubrobacterales bacterium]